MLHYHGTPISGGDATRVLRGRHALVPFAYPEQLPDVMAVASSFVVDNSAFTTWKRGEAFDFVEYRKWCEDIHTHPSFDWCLIPDVIDGDLDENIAHINDWDSSVLGVPVYHMHEPLEHLDWLIRGFRIVAIGSSGDWPTPGTVGWWSRMGEIIRVACNSNGRARCKLHGLRMLDPAIFSRLPLSSADSCNAGINAGSVKMFGSYVPVTAQKRFAVIADRIEAHNSAERWEQPQMRIVP